MTRGVYQRRKSRDAPADALESTAPERRVRTVSAFRKERAPHHLAMVDPHNLAPVIAAIRARMRQHQRFGGFTCYLFIDAELRVFVVSEAQSVVATWLREHPGWLVGAYASRRRDGKTFNPDGTPFSVTDEDLVDAITEHLSCMETP